MGIVYLPKPKQPWEELIRYVDFVDRLATGDTIASCPITATDEEGTDVTATLITAGAISTTFVYYTLKGGTHGKTYTIRFKATSTAGAKVEEDVVVVVKEY
jgi:hypothetical protein